MRSKSFLIINIIGLSIGLAVTLVLFLFVATELSYDSHFENKDRIVRLNSVWIENGQRSVLPINLRKAYTDLPSLIPGIESAVQIYRGFQTEVIKDRQRFQNVNLLFSDPQFFDVFKMHFLCGTPSSALSEPNAVVITDRLAEKVFGSIDVLGKTFTIEGQVCTVTGVVTRLPANTHFNFDVLASMKSIPYLDQMGGLEFFTYYLLKPNVSKEAVCQQINNVHASMLKEGFKEFNSDFESITEDLSDIYLRSKAGFQLGVQGSVGSVLLIAGLAMLILLLAITNFVNLFVVQGDARALEVGIRKAIGGGRRDIAYQFFTEASAIVIIAFIIGIGLADILLEPFSKLINKVVEPSLIFSPLFISGILFMIAVTILLSASYPAFYLSRFRPVEVFKKAKSSSKRRFTTSITIFQSVITIVLVSVILIINKQLKYLNSLPKGYNADNVMVIFGVNENIASHYPALRDDLEKLSQVRAVSSAQHVVGGGCSGQGIRLLGENEQSVRTINEYRVMPGLSELMEFRLKEGKCFTDDNPLNKSSVIINEAAVRMLDIPDPAVGKKVVMFDAPMEIIGVVNDFYYDSPARPVEPIVLTCYNSHASIIYVRFDPLIAKGDAAQLILPLFRQFDPDFILNPIWCDDVYKNKFEGERALSKIVTASTVLSLIIALLGLFAIHSYSASRRTKEIGVRRVMGESSWSIIWRLSADVIKWIAVAGVIALPVSLYISSTWIENYANRATIGWWLFVLPVLIQLCFSLLATFIVSIRASSRNPVESLRYE